MNFVLCIFVLLCVCCVLFGVSFGRSNFQVTVNHLLNFGVFSAIVFCENISVKCEYFGAGYVTAK